MDEEYTTLSLDDAIKKTRIAMLDAYTGFDNATDEDLIDSYIYEIISLQKKHTHLLHLASLQPAPQEPVSDIHSPFRALVSHVFG